MRRRYSGSESAWAYPPPPGSFDPPDGFDLPIWDVAMFDSADCAVESVSHRRLIERAAQWVEEHFDERH